MSEPKRDDEPTMEEILASIRKIISEDDPEEAEAAAYDANDTGDDEEPEPMELTQMVSEDGSVVDLRAEQRATLAPFHDKADDGPAEELDDEESEAPVVEPLVPEGTRVHAELVDEAGDDGLEFEAEEPEPVSAEVGPRGVEDAPEPEEVPELEEIREPALEGLVSAEVAAAATAAMSRLKHNLAAERAAGGGSGKTLEALVCEAMAPHLKAWLDQNLAELVERIVREEIAKLVKRS
ncbi:MAG TPA: DUF2497 domain-containing protein [Kiloniellales bacterium]